MANSTSPQPSFSPGRRWSIAFSVTLATLAVFAIMVGINYLSSQQGFFKRFYLSADTQVRLSPRTVAVLKALTNQVDVTIYYDKSDPLYGDIVSLLNEYQSHTKKLSVRTVDYYSDPGAAAEMQAKYNLGGVTNKNFIIFAANGQRTAVDGSWLTRYNYEYQMPTNSDDPRIYINKKLAAFNGEMLFTAKLFALTQAKPLKAYFLLGHGERSPTDQDDVGFSKLAEIFHRNDFETDTITNLLGPNVIPPDCALLVIAGPRAEFQQPELDKISQYLDQGGRLFAMFDVGSVNHQLGLENVLAKWNVRVTHYTVHDPNNSNGETGAAFLVSALAVHDIMKPILGSQLEIVKPRVIERAKAPSQTATDEPQVTELAFSSPSSTLEDNPNGAPHPYPLMVAVERGPAKGVVTERGTTRMLITGDSLFLGNKVIDYSVNQDFADSAINWLLERTTLLAGVGPRPVTEYRLLMNQRQVSEVKGILLGAIPGGILLLGGLVWLRRRK